MVDQARQKQYDDQQQQQGGLARAGGIRSNDNSNSNDGCGSSAIDLAIQILAGKAATTFCCIVSLFRIRYIMHLSKLLINFFMHHSNIYAT